MRPNIKLFLQYLCIAVIAGFLAGLITSGFDTINHNYIGYGTLNLALLSLGEHINKYTFQIVLASIALLALVMLTKSLNNIIVSKMPALSKILNKRVIGSILISLVILYIFQEIARYYYKDIILLLKASPLGDMLDQVTESKRNTRRIYKSVINVSGLVAFMLSVFILFRSRISEKIINALYKLSFSGFIPYSAIFVVVIIASLNIYLISYKRLSVPEGPNIVLISIDTLRADRLSSYGNPRNTSPNIDKLAEKGVLFENAYSQAPWTLPAMVTVHTALYPTEHGVMMGPLAIKKSLNTLAEQMKNSNYKTIAITSHAFVDRRHGFAQGFDIFSGRNHKGANDSSAQRITTKAKKLLRENKDDKFLLWLHYFDPHSSYIDRDEYSYGVKTKEYIPDTINAGAMNAMIDDLNDEDVNYIVDVYDEEVSYSDNYVGEIMETVRELGLEENTVFIITSDHGEELLDRTRFGHGRNTYDELIRVPLIIYHPEKENELAGLRVKHSVETREIPKTVLSISGVDTKNFDGNDLLDVARDNGDSIAYFAFSEGSSSSSKGVVNQAIIWEEWKLIRNLKRDNFELYNLKNDPGEKVNLIEEQDQETDVVRGILSSRLSKFKKKQLVEHEIVEFSKEDIDELKALGYMQ